MTAPGAGHNAGGGGRSFSDPLAHQHPIFVSFGIEYGKLARLKQDTGPMVENMASYVQAFKTDEWFDTEWEKLSRWAHALGLDGPGLSLKAKRMEWRIRQFNLIMQAANRYHLLETAGTTTRRHLDETAARLGSAKR